MRIAIKLALVSLVAAAETKKAVFAMGCFWCGEEAMESINGVYDVKSGYTGGRTKNPSYRQVTGGSTGHLEAVEVTYNSTTVTYNDLLYHFWRNIDPLNGNGQFCDRGESYESAIFCNK